MAEIGDAVLVRAVVCARPGMCSAPSIGRCEPLSEGLWVELGMKGLTYTVWVPSNQLVTVRA